ncbi:MAG: N-glycosylase/DNA lyase [Candidatus Omnitrophica bacterium]|nr:N-glycosylase/DNA lyase [Candidatus Omnitrophota bacterium]
MKHLVSDHRRKRTEIKKRLNEFCKLRNAKDADIFGELCFCLLTPQSKALNCDKAIKNLKKNGLLFSGGPRYIASKLKGLVRFHNKKSNFLVEARKNVKCSKGFSIRKKLISNNPFQMREWLVANIKGIGHKEASHFLRNIGFGQTMAILDTHILKNLKRHGVITSIPTSITKKNYLAIESKMQRFSDKINIPIDELDLLFWSQETGHVFK